MGVARIFTPENRLAEIIGGPHDATAESLEQRATERVSTLGPNLRAHVFERLSEVERFAGQPVEVLFAECKALGDIALAICEIAGPAGLAPLGEAARGIVIMADAAVNHGVWHAEALKVHINTLMMFAAKPELPRLEAVSVLARLKAMRDGIGVPE